MMPVAKKLGGKEIDKNSQQSVRKFTRKLEAVYDKKPATTKGLLRIVNDAARRISEKKICKRGSSSLAFRRVEKYA